MKGDLSRFVRHSSVYAFGNILYRGASFFLVPLYAHALAPEEFGRLEIFVVTAAILQTLLSSGIAHATLRFYYDDDDPEARRTVVSTALIASFAFSVLCAAVLSLFAGRASTLMFHTPVYATAFRIAFLSLVFEISREISLTFVRAREQSRFFVAMSLVQLIVQVAANVLTVVVLHLGVLGILIGNLTATFTVWTVLTANTLRACGWRVHMERLRPVLAYGYPLMLSGLVAAVFGSSDRYLLNLHASLAAVGIYALGLRVTQVIPVLLVDPFTKSFGPFRFAIMKLPDAHAIYNRILTLFVLVGSLAALVLSLFANDVVDLVSLDAYGGAGTVVPLLAVSAVIGGANYVFQTAIYLQKQTKQIFRIALATGAMTLGLNLLLIPYLHAYGAAISNLAVALLSISLTYLAAQRLQPIAYDLRRPLRIAGAALLLGLAARALAPAGVMGLLVKAVAAAALVPVGLRAAGLSWRHVRIPWASSVATEGPGRARDA